jgi:hydrogenase maturation protein HypF
MGRLFDGLACLAGMRPRIDHEGEAARALEHAAGRELAPGQAYPLPLEAREGAWVADWGPLVGQLQADLARGVARGEVSARVHRGLVELALDLARRGGCEAVALTGGCFQNRLLRTGVARRLSGAGFQVLLPREVPPNDGGLALGQLWVAASGSPRG